MHAKETEIHRHWRSVCNMMPITQRVPLSPYHRLMRFISAFLGLRSVLQQAHKQHKNTTNPSIVPPTTSPISRPLGPGFPTSINGILAPTVVFTQTKNVSLRPAGSGESCERGNGAVLLSAGIFAGSAAVLLYPSKDSANVDAR